LGARDDDGGLVAERAGDERKTDAGVAGSAFDDATAGPERAALLGVADDPQRRAVLHRLSGIEEFRLAENLAAGGLAGAAKADERRIADGVENRACDHARYIAGERRPRNPRTAIPPRRARGRASGRC